jgi:ribosomal protein S8
MVAYRFLYQSKIAEEIIYKIMKNGFIKNIEKGVF